MKNPVVALIQLKVQSNKEQNLFHAVDCIRQAAAQGADIVVLPEMFNCPYQTMNFPLYAEPAGGNSYTAMRQVAQECGVYVFAGSMPESEEGEVYNTAYAFDPEGNEIGKHRKIHLFDIDVKDGQRFKESETLSPGRDITVADTKFGKIGLCVCYDFRFPELCRIMALKGAVAVIVPGAFNMTTGPAHWELLFRGRAADNQIYTIGVAPARDMAGPYVSYANSIVCSPWGDVVTRLGEEEEIRLVTLKLERIEEVRAGLPLMYQRREDVYTLRAVADKEAWEDTQGLE